MSLTFGDLKDNKKNKDLEAISIVKGNRNSNFNKLVYLNTNATEGKKKLDIPLTNFFNILPSTDPNKRDVFYISGKSGSGKSYISTQIIENYHKLYPERHLYLISKLEEDETIDKVKAPLKRIPVEHFIENFNINNFNNCLIMLDDYDTIEGKAGKALQEIIKDIAIMGRKHNEAQGNITLILATHYLTNYSKTRLILNEATHFIVYPQNTSHYQLKYLLQNYVGLSEKETKKLKKLGRWVAFKVGYPQYMISQNEIRLLNVDSDDDDVDENDIPRRYKKKTIEKMKKLSK
jgi:Cdc6-like AAA superfamily ATPase